jgi:hypothetical protein
MNNNDTGYTTLIDCPGKKEFLIASNNLRKPVVLKNSCANWPAFTKWDVAYFSKLYGDKLFQVSVGNQGQHMSTKYDSILDRLEMTMNEFIAIINTDAKHNYYLAQTSVQDLMPELLEDIDYPSDYLPNREVTSINIWFGLGGNQSPLHYDGSPNFIAMIAGGKTVKLFAPNQSEYLYKHSVYDAKTHVSQINMTDVNEQKFPKFKLAKLDEIKLFPGDILYLPPFWWHSVRGDDGINISLNAWYSPKLFDLIAVPPMQYLPKLLRILKLFRKGTRLSAGAIH